MESITNYKNISLRCIVLLCVIVFSFIPDVGIRFSTAGFTWNAYRFFIVICLIYTIIINKKIDLKINGFSSKWMAFLLLWIVDGVLLFLIGDYSDYHKGFLELLSVFYGLIILFIFKQLFSVNDTNLIVSMIYLLLNFLIIIGFFEILTGYHFPASAFNDPNSSLFEFKVKNLATGFMYNVNDFSAMITCMTPILLYERLGKKRIITLVGVIAINFINDSTICNMAIAVFVFYYFLVLSGDNRRQSLLLKVIFLVVCMMLFLVILMRQAELTNRNDILGAIARQIRNFGNSTGSMYMRINIYKDSIKACLNTRMLGIGPGGFINYFSSYRSVSGLKNPHSLVLEILVEYGILIAIGFICFFVILFIRAKKLYNETNEDIYLMVVSFVVVYVIASFAPSSFICYSYQWLLVAFMCVQLDESKKSIGGIINA